MPRKFTKLFLILLCTTTITACSDKNSKIYNKKQLVNSVLNEMIYVPGGTFDFQTSPNAKTTLDNYYMTKYAITWGQYKSFYKLVYHKDKIPLNPDAPDPDMIVYYSVYSDELNGNTNSHAVFMNLEEARHFCQWIGQQVNLPMGLPTEEQWEYAARSGGKDVMFSTNNGKLEPGKNFPDQNDLKKNVDFLVNFYPPNPMGFYMMNANGFELTSSCWDDYGYSDGYMHNPKSDIDKCIKENKQVVVRGTTLSDIGGYLSKERDHNDYLTSIYLYNRTYEPPDTSGNFRCVINSSQKPLPKL